MQDLQSTLFRYGVYYPTVFLRGQNVPRYLRSLRHSQYVSEDAQLEMQRRKLVQLLAYARNYVPAYRDIDVSRAGPEHSVSELLANIPPVTKTDIIRGGERYRSSERFFLLTPKTTGGSTGQSITIPKTRDALARELAATWRSYEWTGVTIGDRQARLWGIPHGTWPRNRARLIDFIANRRRLSAFGTSDEDLAEFCERMRRFKPTFIYGYASLIARLADFESEARTGFARSVKSIISTSEVLTDAMRERITSSFDRPVFNEYGCGELGSVAHECERGSLHVMAENMIVEILRDGEPCAPGEPGELTITELNNLALPLIRYRTGDFAAWADAPCDCGRSLPVISHVFGRAYDYIRDSQGRDYHPEFFMYIMEEAKQQELGIEAFQIIEQGAQELLIRLVPGAGFGESATHYVSERILNDFDPTTRITFETVDAIARERSGKMRLIKARAPEKTARSLQ